MDGAISLQVCRFGRLYLRPIAAHKHEACQEGTEDLRENVMRDLLPWKTLPDCWSGNISTGGLGSQKDALPKQMVMAGLKWPPDTGAQVMIAKAIPIAKAQPI